MKYHAHTCSVCNKTYPCKGKLCRFTPYFDCEKCWEEKWAIRWADKKESK
jgi:hypothetical protein